jgi:hypothetical protein
MGIVLGALAFVGVLGIALAALAFRRGGDTERAVSDLEVGDCLVQPGDTEYLFEVVDCDERHDDEVFAAGRLNPEGTAVYPELSTLRAQIEQICVGRAFDDYVGIPTSQTTYKVLFITPDGQAWQEARGAYVCVIDSGGTPLRGSARNTKR